MTNLRNTIDEVIHVTRDWKEQEPKSDVKKLAEDHWKYNKPILDMTIPTHGMSKQDIINLVEYFYISALVHGYKHAQDDSK